MSMELAALLILWTIIAVGLASLNAYHCGYIRGMRAEREYMDKVDTRIQVDSTNSHYEKIWTEEG